MSGVQGTKSTQRIAGQGSLLGQTIGQGQYHIQAVLGHGGMGQVFLASHTSLNVQVALKQCRADLPLPNDVVAELNHLLHDDSITPEPRAKSPENIFSLSGGTHTDRFLREALFLARLQHSSIPALYDYFFEGGCWYLVMDYIPGSTLAAYIREHAPLPPLEVITYAMQLCDVLQYLHEQDPPVIFRDLKPSNLLLHPDGRLVLVDFGITRYFKSGQISDTIDLGSPGYASPEQYQGEGQTDARSDLFSLGVILHEMISGQQPIAVAGGREKLPSLHHVNPAVSQVLSGLVTIATRLEPLYRFQSARTFYVALERAYALEESRAYQQHIVNEELTQQLERPSARVLDTPPPTGAEEKTTKLGTRSAPIPSIRQKLQGGVDTLSPLSLLQRREMRAALQAARRKHAEAGDVEKQLLSVDAIPQKDITSPLVSTPLPIPVDENTPVTVMVPPRMYTPHHSRKSGSRIFQAGLLLVSVLALIVTSVIIYTHLSSSHQAIRTSSVSRSSTAPHSGTMEASPTSQVTSPTTSIPTSSWHILPSIPSPEADNTAVYLQVQGRSYMYMTGGFRGAQAIPRYDHRLYRYDIVAARWETVMDTTFPAMINSAAVVDENNHIFFTAAYSPDIHSVISLLYMYQPTTGTLQRIVPPSQVSLGFAAAMIADQQGHIYIMQGFTQAGNPHAIAGTGWYQYDIATGQWHTLAPEPMGLGYATLGSDGAGNIFLMDGAVDAGRSLPTTNIYRYNIQYNTWTPEQTTAPGALSGAASCMNAPGQLVIMGGNTATDPRGQHEAWLVDLHTLHWTPLTSLPFDGSLLGAAACDRVGHVFLVRGTMDAANPGTDFGQMTLQGL